MQYRKDRNGTPLSILGYGCMRFTKKGGGEARYARERPRLDCGGVGAALAL